MERRPSSKRLKPAEISSVTNANVGEIVEWQNEEKSETVVVKVQKNENNIDDNSWILSVLPPGYKFCPRDDELIKLYLMKKVMNEPLPLNRIYDVSFYSYSPHDLARDCKPWSGQWYFFTPRERKYRNGKRPNRGALGGYWKATGADKKVKEGNDVIGERRTLVFYIGKAMRGIKTDWIMHEFRIDGLSENTRTRTESNMRLDDWVLCRIYEKKQKEEDSKEKVMDGQKNSIDNHPSTSQPALQVSIADAPFETPIVTQGLVVLPSSPPRSMESVNLSGSNHPNKFPQHNYSHFWSEDNRELICGGDSIFTPFDDFDNQDFMDKLNSQPETIETMKSFIDDSHFFESYDGQSQYGFIESNQGSVTNFAADILPPTGFDNDYMASHWNNYPPVTFNSQLPPPDALIRNPSPMSQIPLGYIDQNNDMQLGSVRETRFMDRTNGMQQDRTTGMQQRRTRGMRTRGRQQDRTSGMQQERTSGMQQERTAG